MAINHPPVWRIKVVLADTSPMVWRRFDTYATITLSQLHYFIQGVMGWELGVGPPLFFSRRAWIRTQRQFDPGRRMPHWGYAVLRL
ncbi:hypothetical protein ABXJ76_06360 [Methylobacter sp. G7]|uniref:IS1096 element passenger TnpR family protein n=1 Tax=Methylobacter sp. G7 TaxID=3230117 RepID=UPI003D8083A8